MRALLMAEWVLTREFCRKIALLGYLGPIRMLKNNTSHLIFFIDLVVAGLSFQRVRRKDGRVHFLIETRSTGRRVVTGPER